MLVAVQCFTLLQSNMFYRWAEIHLRNSTKHSTNRYFINLCGIKQCYRYKKSILRVQMSSIASTYMFDCVDEQVVYVQKVQ